MTATRKNPTLAIFGNPAVSERRAWNDVLTEAQTLRGELMKLSYGGRTRDHAIKAIGQIAERLADLAILMRGQAIVRGNPGPQGDARITKPIVSSAHVQAIAYIHKRDGKPYIHGFGNAELNEQHLQDGWLDLSELKTKTDVAMTLNPDGTITIRGTRGQSLAALFED